MENRLCLNKRPIYTLPDEVLVDEYARRKINPSIPNFEPDIVICNWGKGNIGKVRKKKQDAKQIWVKTDNENLITFIKLNEWKDVVKGVGSPYIGVSLFKKILLEEFYEVKNDRK